jgi:restriction system protein
MSVWIHQEEGENLPLYTTSNTQCRFCNTNLIQVDIDDHWVGIPKDIVSRHKETILGMAEAHGDFILEEMDLISEPDEQPAFLCVCPLCGWWHVSKDIDFWTRTQIWFVRYSAVASLRKFDQVDIRIPATEIRQYLITKYEARYNVNPRCFEDVVASVFSSCGFQAEVTTFSADGGIDIILHNRANQTIAVQVKRHKGAIQVSLIRELLGAMVLGGYTKGIFVTTSKFQTGAFQAIDVASKKGLAIKLVDGDRFLQSLRLAQTIDFPHYLRLLKSTVVGAFDLKFEYDYHGNSL